MACYVASISVQVKSSAFNYKHFDCMFRLMHQGPGVVEPSFQPSSFRGVVGSRHHGKRASTNHHKL